MAKQITILSVLLFASACATHERGYESVAPTGQSETDSSSPAAPANGWNDVLSSNEDQPLSNLPRVIPVSVNTRSASVRVVNEGSTPLMYYATGPSNIQLFQELKKDGQWMAANWDWCGTGKSDYEIAPGSSTLLNVMFWDSDQTQRMLGYFREKDSARGGLVVLAAQPAE